LHGAIQAGLPRNDHPRTELLGRDQLLAVQVICLALAALDVLGNLGDAP
jgi:hypothetical protein